MTTQDIETVGSKTASALVALAVAAVLAGVLGFSFLTDQPMLTRVGILAGGILLGVGIAWFSPPASASSPLPARRTTRPGVSSGRAARRP